ncbi:class I SAM-dependent methyltransferase [Desulfovibrio oxamicus]|uniref:Class I SAM-dependent methyltransferase n=1 Tax=Nitratidesulfovibrio oxamicus TaxID=32016 RepID=A0ABS0J873_9BACT|nr:MULTISPECIES: class I SAM-dependent methyltransferase [Nitratidesulfovibrio]MBG3878662.1 class I SAM-dependent methyltransferase [Nitratidesulfovibrio oxamicus]
MSSQTRDREIYLHENRYEQPKEIFKHLAALVADRVGVPPGAKVCDAGCAAGEFLYHFLKVHPQAIGTGFDLVPELVEKAQSMVPAARFSVGSVTDAARMEAGSQDFVFMNGVHSSLPEIKPALETLVGWTKPGGRVYLFGIFNPYPLDVASRYRAAGDAGDWTTLYIHSRAGVSRCLDDLLGPDRHTFEPFLLDVDVAPVSDNPFRSWTFRDESGQRLLTNGLCTLINCYVLEIRP